MSYNAHGSRGIKKLEEQTKGAMEILIPYSIAVNRYRSLVVGILDQLAVSGCFEAKQHQPEQFKWYLLYTQPDDPQTNDKEEFVRQLEANTSVFLVTRGWKFKGIAELNGEMPEQIRERYQQRAKLMTSSVADNTDVGAVAISDGNVDAILSSLAQLALTNAVGEVGIGYVKIAELAMQNFKLISRK